MPFDEATYRAELGVGLPDDNAHAPNEKFSLDQFYGGIRSVVRMFDRIGETAG